MKKLKKNFIYKNISKIFDMAERGTLWENPFRNRAEKEIKDIIKKFSKTELNAIYLYVFNEDMSKKEKKIMKQILKNNQKDLEYLEFWLPNMKKTIIIMADKLSYLIDDVGLTSEDDENDFEDLSEEFNTILARKVGDAVKETFEEVKGAREKSKIKKIEIRVDER